MTESELLEIEARANAATAGPWALHTGDGTIRGPVGEIATMRATCVTSQWEADADFISVAREEIPALLAEVRSLKSYIQEHLAECPIIQQEVEGPNP